MTAPTVLPAAPAVRAAPTAGTSTAGGSESATPFASALDGVLAAGRGPVGEEPSSGEDEGSESPAATVVPGATGAAGELATTAGLSAALWALGLGSPQLAGAPTAGAAGAAGNTVALVAAGEGPGAGPAAPVVASAVGPAVVPPGEGLPPDLVLVAPDTPGAGAPGAGAGPDNGPTAFPAAGTAAAAAAAGTTVPPSAPGTPIPGTPTPGAPASGLPGIANASPAGAGGPGSDAGGADPGGDFTGTTPAVLAGPAPATPTAADADGATGAAASQPVAGQVARQLAVFRSAPDGTHTMTLVLTPETLGPVEVSVTVTKGAVDLVLRGAHEHGRAALLDALPDLRRDLEAAGLTTSRVEVARDGAGSLLDRQSAGREAQQGFGDRSGQQNPSEGRSRPWLRPADSGETRTVPTTGSASSGVDVRV